MNIRKGIELSQDVIASIKTSGLIGDKYVKLTPGIAEDMLRPGEMITQTESAIDIEELISKYVFGGV
jgi:phospholipid/cholesterol/gamma-HCH transport system substrate-binding protein